MKHIILFCLAFLLVLGTIFMMAPRRSDARFATGEVTLGTDKLHVKVPMTPSASAQGLSGVTNLTDKEGMLWQFTPATRPTFWMKDMRMDLDFIWIRDDQVVEVTPNVPAPTSFNLPTYQPASDITNVLEVRAGFAADHHIIPGTSFSLQWEN